MEIFNDPKESMYFRNDLFLFLIAYHISNIKTSVLEISCLAEIHN